RDAGGDAAQRDRLRQRTGDGENDGPRGPPTRPAGDRDREWGLAAARAAHFGVARGRGDADGPSSGGETPIGVAGSAGARWEDPSLHTARTPLYLVTGCLP